MRTSTCAATTCTVGTPGNGQGNAVIVRVQARNAIGLSDPIDAPGPIWSDVIPPAPQGLRALPLDGRLAIEWQPVSTGAGSAVRSYVVTVAGVSSEVDAATCTATVCSTVSQGIPNGSQVPFTVKITLSPCTSTPSGSIRTTPGCLEPRLRKPNTVVYSADRSPAGGRARNTRGRTLPGRPRLALTRPADRATAGDPASYRLEHYRYEYTGAYGSPELDRTAVKVERAEMSADGRTVDLTTAPLVADRVYLVTAAGVRSAAGEPPVHPTGAYTLNVIPAGGK